LNLLVTGGAGYIGSHFCKAATKVGHDVVVYDNLSAGHKKFVKFGPFEQGDIRDTQKVIAALKEHRVEAIVHFAAKALVGESMKYPELYYSNNTWGTASVFEAAKNCDITKVVFSSSCATYGTPEVSQISETTLQEPINPYGVSKKQSEEIAKDYQRLCGIRVAMLRYFNVAGQDEDGELYEDHSPETHIIPNILLAAKEGRPFTVNGDDYNTPDGSCIRDYVYVGDLVKAHLKALVQLETQNCLVSNVALGKGYSVKEVFEAVKDVLAIQPKVIVGPRRQGDPDRLVADATFFRTWYTEEMKDLASMIATLRPRN